MKAIFDDLEGLSKNRKLPNQMKHEETHLLDFDLWVGMARGKGPESDIIQDFPSTDPLTILETAVKYGLIEAEAAERLKSKFMKSVATAAGIQLTPGQVKKLYTILRHFNPVGHMQPEAKP